MFGRTSASQEEKSALEALRSGDPHRAYSVLRSILDYPGKLTTEESWKSAWTTFAKVADKIAGPALGNLARGAAATPRDVNALYSLGYGLVEQALYGPAATVLSRAHELAPTEELVLTELVCALEYIRRNDLACDILRRSAFVESSFLPRYLLAFNVLMQGDIVESRKWHQGLTDLIDHGSEKATNFGVMETSLREMYRRAELVSAVAPLDVTDLRGWSYVVNNCLLLHLSEQGKDEGMNGRYAFLQENYRLLAESFKRLLKVFNAAKIMPSRVFSLPDRDSEIFARLAAKALNCEVKPWAHSCASEPGIVACYDLTKLDSNVVSTLSTRYPGQFLWCHACRWTDNLPIASEIVTYFHQFALPPWGEQLAVDPEKRTVKRTPALEGSSEHVASVIFNALPSVDECDDYDVLVTFACRTELFVGQHASAEVGQPDKRRMFRMDSPVKSSRFK